MKLVCRAKCKHNADGYCILSSIEINQKGECAQRTQPKTETDDAYWKNFHKEEYEIKDTEIEKDNSDESVHSQISTGGGQF
jgi:hypothetical protein